MNRLQNRIMGGEMLVCSTGMFIARRRRYRFDSVALQGPPKLQFPQRDTTPSFATVPLPSFGISY